MVKTIQAVGYVRMSTDKREQEQSPKQQRIEIERYADREGYQISKWYEDLGISGDKTEKRTGFQQMIADGSGGQFETIVCWDQDRFGRFDLIGAGHWIYPLQQAGVTLATVTSGRVDWNSLVDQLSYMARQMGKAQFLTDLSANTFRSQKLRAEDGQWAAGAVPFGYQRNDETGKLHPGSADEVATLREIFSRYAGGASLRELVDWLSGRDIENGRTRWTPTGLSVLLRNPAYLGRIEFGKSSMSKYRQHNPQAKRIDKDRKDWIVEPDAHPALIEQSQFDLVAERLNSNRRNTGPKKMNGTFALAGLVKCGKCGAPMHGWVERGSRKYLCGQYNSKPGACQRFIVTEADLLSEVLQTLRTEVFDKLSSIDHEQIKQAMREILGSAEQDSAMLNSQIAKVKTRLERLDRRLGDVSKDMMHRIEKQIRQAEEEEAALVDQLKSQQQTPQSVELIENRIGAAMQWIGELESLVAVDYDARKVNEMLKTFVTEVRCDISREPVSSGSRKHVCKLAGGVIHTRPSGLGLPFGELLNREVRN